MKNLLVVDEMTDWELSLPGVEVVSSQEYLTNAAYQELKGARVFNLCSSYDYQESGYYVSLLGTARKHRVAPSVSTILEMKTPTFPRIRSQELDDLIQKTLKDIRSDEFTLSIYFGKNLADKYKRLSAELHKVFNAPLVRAEFVKNGRWRLSQLSPIGLNEVPHGHWEHLHQFAEEYFSRRIQATKQTASRFSLAILLDPEEQMPPSNEKAIKKFIEEGTRIGIETEIITKDDINRLAEFDGLFIRVTTAVNHYTYLFAQKAQSLGIVVIDDPHSILTCTNKVYQAELFTRNHIPSPPTLLVHKSNAHSTIEKVKLPAVLKKPDSSFSKGVVKVETFAELKTAVTDMLAESDLIVVQEFVPTEFDWRIGILDGYPLYACKYFMAKNHWQIYKSNKRGGSECGTFQTISVTDIPDKLLKLAIKAANLIGKGLYGLDVKEYQGRYYIIEINDNPSIDHGVEDKIIKDGLYSAVMEYFLTRMDARARGVTEVLSA